MKISELMIPNPITITEEASIQDAIFLMKTNSIRHLPIVSRGKALKGFVTLADLKQGLIPSMVGDLSLSDLMIKDPITVDPDDDIEIAAQRIYKNKIGGIPVVKKKRLVGIITESDILRAFIDMMGFLKASSHIDVTINDVPGLFRKALDTINDAGGDIISIGMGVQQKGKKTYYFRLSPCKTQPIRIALEAQGFTVLTATD